MARLTFRPHDRAHAQITLRGRLAFRAQAQPPRIRFSVGMTDTPPADHHPGPQRGRAHRARRRRPRRADAPRPSAGWSSTTAPTTRRRRSSAASARELDFMQRRLDAARVHRRGRRPARGRGRAARLQLRPAHDRPAGAVALHPPRQARRRRRAASRLLRDAPRRVRPQPVARHRRRRRARATTTASGSRRPARPNTCAAPSSSTRRECFAAIGGVRERLGWDGIDEVTARMHGFETRSFDPPQALPPPPHRQRRRPPARARALGRSALDPPPRSRPGRCCGPARSAGSSRAASPLPPTSTATGAPPCVACRGSTIEGYREFVRAEQQPALADAAGPAPPDAAAPAPPPRRGDERRPLRGSFFPRRVSHP